MLTKNGVHIIQGARFYIMARFGADFLSHLEKQFDGTTDFFPPLYKETGGTEEHGI